MAISEAIKVQLFGLPAKPGCYLMKNDAGEVIYVGKAINLRSRVRSYFQPSAKHSARVTELVSNIEDLEWIVVSTELEALILEMNLIKRYRPRYNVRLKDDKRYPYIRIQWADPFPKVTVTRRMVKDGSRYFGPYTSAWAVHQTLDALRKIFPYRTCDRVITGEDHRACLYYDIKLCLAPCIGRVNQQQYRAMIKDLCRFLQGDSDPIVGRLTAEMKKASEVLEYEKAAVLRDQLAAIEVVVESRRVISHERIDSDVIAFARDQDSACVQVFFIRSGKLIGREYFILEGAQAAEDQELMEAFVKQFYTQAASIPQRLLLPVDIEEGKIVEAWLGQERGGRVEIRVPRRGVKKELVAMAAENAAETLTSLKVRWEADHQKHVTALAELQQALNLPEPPLRIECYDISNLQGTAAAGSMVVFERGVANKAAYRHFSIKSVQGQDDFASMAEVLQRRFNRWKLAVEKASSPGGKLDKGFGLLPDLLIVDGGKGQLSSALEVLKDYELDNRIPLAGLAKQHEELFLPGKPDPVILPRQSQALFLVQRIRDEAHRFAINHHRSRRSKQAAKSKLDEIPGIGPKRKKALLKTFGSLQYILMANEAEIAAVEGISTALAKTIKSHL
ncbi:MAG: excinuclease ABC subunit UvrC [Anaerolineales bacterium]|nr:excinuclease ABC subunit UvrC [Anaerolineales bacterium]